MLKMKKASSVIILFALSMICGASAFPGILRDLKRVERDAKMWRGSTAPVNLTPEQRKALAVKYATCPFLASAVNSGALPVRNSAANPLAFVTDVVGLGNSGGGHLGNVLHIFATGNHAYMLSSDSGTTLDTPTPDNAFSLILPGSQGSHPGHSSILESDPTKITSGRWSDADFQRMLAHAQNGLIARSAMGAFIAENLRRDPNSRVANPAVALLLLKDLAGVIGGAFSRDAVIALTKALGDDNLIGSCGEFALLFALLENSPNTKTVNGEIALSVADITSMFRDKVFPAGWDQWRKSAHSWVLHTTSLVYNAFKNYVINHSKKH